MSKDYKKLAIDHVRSVCPELMELSFGCEVRTTYNPFGNIQITNWQAIFIYRSIKTGNPIVANLADLSSIEKKEKDLKIIGHTPHLEHWLRGLQGNCQLQYIGWEDDILTISCNDKHGDGYWAMHLDLTKDGENQDSSFYEAYCIIVGITNPN